MGPTETTQEELNGRWNDLGFAVHRTRRYHEMMTAFYARWRDSMKIVTVIAGSGAFFLIFSGAEAVAGAISAFIAMWAVLDIITAPDQKAKLHADLCRSFLALAAKIEAGPVTPGRYAELSAARLELERDEPPCRRLVDLRARNDECRARGFPPGDLVPLSWWQYRLGYFADFGLRRLEAWKAAQHRAA